MNRLTQICVLFVAILCYEPALSSPLFESINIERKINVELKPMKFGPITFIKEKWGPFGKLFKKHTIERRDLDAMNTIDSKIEGPIFEERFIPVVEKEEPIMGPVPAYRPPVQAVVAESEPALVSKLNTDISAAMGANTFFTPAKAPENNKELVARPPILVVVTESAPAPVSKLNTDISAAIPANSFFTPAKAPENNKELEALGAVPIAGSAPIEGPLIVPVTPEAVTPLVIPPSPPPPPVPGVGIVETPPTSRFGAFARFFGEILSEIVNRLIARARLSFGQFASPPATQ